jgi:hypothetical protein
MIFGGLEYVDGKYAGAYLQAAPLMMPCGAAAAATLLPGPVPGNNQLKR